MIYLLLSIISSSLIYITFKLLDNCKINTLYAIVVNYLTACILGYLQQPTAVVFTDIPKQSWFIGALILGVLFIAVFNLMATTAQKSGLSVVSVASKMSVALSIVFVIIYDNEPLSFLKIGGIILALIAVYLVSVKTKSTIHVKKSNLIFPILVFLGSGVIESLIKYLEGSYVAKDDVALFSSALFAAALAVGIVAATVQFIRKRTKFRINELIGGIVLGIPNYFSIYFFIQALRAEGFNSSTIFILNNVAIVLLSTFLGILFFKEKLIRKNWIGIVLAVVSIILVAYATY